MAHRIAKSLDKLRSQESMRDGQSATRTATAGLATPHTSRRGSATDYNPHVKERIGGKLVTALDITHDPKSGCDAGVIAEVLIASRDPRIKYIIWNRQIIAGDAGPSPCGSPVNIPGKTPTLCTSIPP